MSTLGIDFGTGNSVVAKWAGTKATINIDISGNGAVRSDMLVACDGTITPDPMLLLTPPEGASIEEGIKRRLIVALDKGDSAATTYLTRLAAARLKYIYDAFVNSVGDIVVKTVLTCPANTGQAYRTVLLEIGRQIGLPAVDIVDEPTAAAVHHGLSEVAQQDERWLVMDWGCGTCDVSLIERKAGSRDLKVVCVKGDNELGGMDMDQLLTTHLASKFNFAVDTVPAYLVEDIKKRLSKEEYVDANITLKTGKLVAVTCSRAELDKLVEPLLARGKALIEDALTDTAWHDGGVDRIIATGGPMMMPSVHGLIKSIADGMGAILLDSDPLTSVALGAARLAEIKRIGGLVVTNKVAKSIGIRVAGGEGISAYHKIIHRGEDRPVTRSVTLATSVNLQDVIEIEIREGDNEASAEANTRLASLNAVVRPEDKGKIRVKLQISLSDAGGMEAYISPVGDKDTVRDFQAVGVRLGKGERKDTSSELRTDDPVIEFQLQVIDRESDPDTARQVYERLKIKYHPDRDPAKREHWNARIRVLDEIFDGYLLEIEKRMRAATVPNVPWDNQEELGKIVVDEILAHRLTHCLAHGIGSEVQRKKMPEILRRYPDYRRILASYLFGVKRNPILQKMLVEDNRPHVGLVVLLQNIPGKTIRERHEVLKAAYRVKEDKVRELLQNPKLDIEKLYKITPTFAEAEINPMSGTSTVVVINPDGRGLKFEYQDGNTVITGNTYSFKEDIKQHGARWDGKNVAWVIKGKRITEKDIFPGK